MPLLLALAIAAGPPQLSADKPQQLVDVGEGRRIHLQCAGTGSPTIVLTAGLGDSGASWASVMPQLAEHHRTCAWDRAGMGFSDPSPLPQDALHTTADLEAALKAAKVGAPYVMVGHSIGSFETLLFTYRHPGEVAGIVLVDPSSPYQNRRFGEVAPGFAALNRERMASRSISLSKCADALAGGREDAENCGTPSPGRTTAQRLGSIHSIVSMGDEMERASSDALSSARRPLGRLPLIVLTASKPMSVPPELAAEAPKVRVAWVSMHDRLAAESARGVNRVVEGSSHYIQNDRPDAVIAAVEEVAGAAARG